MNTPTYEQIKPYLESKLVSEGIHPEDENVRIYNYSQKAQFAKAWDDVTLNCRGLIMNVKTGQVLARPFPKFFNYQEHLLAGKTVPYEEPIITDKLDGSLGILYHLNDKPRISTRGSFTSDQAIWATEWLSKTGKHYPDDGYTHLFEIIYPANRIVVNYDFSGLVHLAAINTKTGEQVVPLSRVEIAAPEQMRRVRVIPPTDLESLAKMDEPNSEGFVLFYPRANLRLKIKFPEYVRLHKILTGLSEIGIWEHLRAGKPLDELLVQVPDEFFKWVGRVADDLQYDFNKLWWAADMCIQLVRDLPTRKEQAIAVNRDAPKVSGIVFARLDGQETRARDMVWRMLRPHGSSTFQKDIDG